MWKRTLMNLNVKIMVVDRKIDIACEVNVDVKATTHETHQEEEKVHLEVDRGVESIAPEVNCEINNVLLEVVLKDVQEVAMAVRVAIMLNGIDKMQSIVLENRTCAGHIHETNSDKVSNKKGELVQEAFADEELIDNVPRQANPE